MTVENPDALFDGVARFIDESNALLQKGEFVEMSGLDKQVRRLCESALKLSGEQRVQYADRLQQIMASLQMLGKSLEAARDKIGAEINGLSAHKKANVAYQKIEASDKKKPEEE